MTADAAPPDAAERVAAILLRYRDDINHALRTALDRPDIGHFGYMRYHLGWQDAAGNAIDVAGGKMLRPALVLVSCEAVGGDRSRAMAAAAAFELVHNFTLIHDDIEDSSDTRHGRDTVWRIAGVPQAINAGDGMFVIAQRTLLTMADAGVSADRVLAAATALNEACVYLCEGQYLDIGFETRDRVAQAEYETMIAGKTAALLGASMAVGAIAGGADEATAAAFAECGRLLGRAFQVQDDVLGIWGEVAVTGKPVADDIRSKKKSFPVVWAFEHLTGPDAERLSRAYAAPEMTDATVDEVLSLLDAAGARATASAEAARWAEQAVAVLRPIALDPERRRDIEAIAAFFVQRSA
jgi:geranylgeranyl diphosphate synthase type I